MAQVFVSYAHKNDKFVAVLKQKLLEAGFEPMIDTDYLRPGEDWRQEIDASIHSSFALITVMTPDAFESKYVTYEWAFALGLGIKVIPLMLEQTKLHPRLDALQYILFDDHFNLDPAWEKLLTRLGQIQEAYQNSPKAKVLDDLPAYVRNAIDIFNHPEYFTTTDKGLVGNLTDAVKTLSTSKHPTAREAFLRGLEYPNPVVRRSIIEICGTTRDKATIPALVGAIRDHDKSVRTAAITALALIGDEECVAGLTDALEDSDWNIRVSAADGLSNFKSIRAVSALLKALQDNVGRVRAHAAQSLGIIGNAKAILGLIKLLDDETETAQRSAQEALEKIGTPKAMAAVKERQNDRKNLAKSNEPVQELLENLKGFTVSLGNDVKFKQLKHYIVYERRKNFISIMERTKRIDIFLNLNPDDVELEIGFTRDMRYTGHLSTGDLLVTIEDADDLEKAKSLIKRSYEAN